MDTTYVSVDLELLDSGDYGREILEIAAVRFRGDRELETYSALVQTRAPLSHRVARLTGLTLTDLAQAVPLAVALRDLERMVASTPLVGQSIELDLEQLRRAGLTLRVPALDTFELANLLVPGLPTYDLESVARAVGVTVGDDRHRALADARLAMKVFNRLVERAGALDLDTLRQVNRLARPLTWPLRLVFAEAERSRSRPLGAFSSGPNGTPASEAGAEPAAPAWLVAQGGEPARPRETLVAREPRILLDIEALARELSPGGELAGRLDGFEERPEQLEMLRAVAEAFNEAETLLVEAGTGTGKSLAYLLPAVHFAAANGRRVVVSTNTINLQDQLCQKELPELRRATGLPLKVCVLKGRANYVCLRRWVALLHAEELSPEERSLLIKTLLWLPTTRSGDRAELRLVGREEDAWLKVAALADGCTPQHCTFNRLGRCFIARARRAAESSHLVVVNHSLLLADLATKSKVIPDYDHLIVDEAHHLEDEATAQLGWSLGSRELATRLERLWEGQGGRSGAGGLVPEAIDLLERSGAVSDSAALGRLSADLGYLVGALAEELPALFTHLRRFVNEHGQRSESGAMAARLSASSRAQPSWSDIEILWDERNRYLLRLLRELGELLRALEAVADHSDEWEELSGELAIEATAWDSIRERLWGVLAEPNGDTVDWLSIGRNDDLYVNAAPLLVGQHLRERLFARKQCVVLTSATLAAEGSFRYVRERLGLDEARELLLGSPFDYERSVLVYLPSDLPEPSSPGYQAAVELVTGQVIAALDGRTLVLFTSYSQLRATYQALKEPLELRQIILLGQRMDGSSRARLLESFKGGDRVALMGTTSFWEGVDVVGDALSCLIMARLPFATPSDPVFQARGEMFEDPFGQYAVPQAILRFRQGFGRLIRSRTDRGVLIVLDRRLKTRAYGRAFLGSLPGCEVREGPGRRAAAAAREWLAAASDRAAALAAAPVDERRDRDRLLPDHEGGLE